MSLAEIAVYHQHVTVRGSSWTCNHIPKLWIFVRSKCVVNKVIMKL